MGFSFRKRVKTSEHTWTNISGSGVSKSARFGPFTVNSRGRVSVRLGKGLTWRGKL